MDIAIFSVLLVINPFIVSGTEEFCLAGNYFITNSTCVECPSGF